MADTTVTLYECERGLLPAVCVQCGSPATGTVQRPLPVPPKKKWTCAWVLSLVLLLYLAVPAVIIVLPWLWRRAAVGIPVCDDHRDHWDWRRRVRTRVLWPPVVVASLAVQAACLAGFLLHPVAYAHAAAGVLVVGFAIDWLTIGRREVGVLRAGDKEVRLNNVHPTFLAALIEERARDRVDNPDRRALRGDVRDDYDDEPV
jgi:hypothetical protein